MKTKIIFLIFHFTCISFFNTKADESNEFLKNENLEKVTSLTKNKSTSDELLNCPDNQTITISSGCNTSVSWTPPSSDKDNSTLDSTHSSGDIFEIGKTIVTYTEKNPGGITRDICSFIVNVKPTANYALNNCPADIIIDLDENCDRSVSWIPPQVPCGVQLTSTHQPGESFPLGTTTVTYTSSKDGDIYATCSFTITLNDDLPPEFDTFPTDMTLVVDNSCEAVANWDVPVVSDNCDLPLELVSDFTNGSTFPLGTTTVIYTITDDGGNKAQCSFDVTVLDNTGPELLNLPERIRVSADENCEAIVTWEPIIGEDNCSTNVDIDMNFNSGDIFPLGETTVEVLATDESSNETTSTFIITVEDHTAPQVVSCPADITISAKGNCESMVTWKAPEFSDNCNTDLSITSTHNNGTQFPFGFTTVTYTATDDAGNSTDCSFNVIVEDNSAPKITYCPVKQTISANDNCLGIAEWEEPVFEDCSNLSIRSNYQKGMELPSGITLIEYIATDDEGFATSCSFEVEVLDQSPPRVENCPKDISIVASDDCEALVEWAEPTVTDNCTEVSISSNYEPGSAFPVGKTNVEYEFTDENGNKSHCRFEVNVTDGSEIVMDKCPENIIVKAENNDGVANVSWESPTVTTDCSEIIINSSHEPGSTFELGTTTVTYTFTKQNGQIESCSFNIIVEPLILKIEISKLITPNGDGNNDFWLIKGIEHFPDNHIIIVDKWGAEIYSAKGYNNDKEVWKGENKNGEIVPRGTYYYYIKVKNELEAIERKGFLEILR